MPAFFPAILVIVADGMTRPEPAAPGVVWTSTLGARTFDVVATKDGAVVGPGVYEFSEERATVHGDDVRYGCEWNAVRANHCLHRA